MINTAGESIRNVVSQYVCFHPHLRSLSNCLELGLRRCALKASSLVSQSAVMVANPRSWLMIHSLLPRFLASLTVALMSRITLHLRRYASCPSTVIIYHDNTAHQHHIRHQPLLSTVSQPPMTFAHVPPSPPSPPPQTIYPPQQPKMRPMLPTPRNDARVMAASLSLTPSLSSLENESHFGMDTFSTVTGRAVPAEVFRT